MDKKEKAAEVKQLRADLKVAEQTRKQISKELKALWDKQAKEMRELEYKHDKESEGLDTEDDTLYDIASFLRQRIKFLTEPEEKCSHCAHCKCAK